METADFKALVRRVSGARAAKRYDPNNVDVTRDFDRALIAKQAEQRPLSAARSLAAPTRQRPLAGDQEKAVGPPA